MNWTQIGERIEGDSGLYGAQPVSVSHDGNRVAIGCSNGTEGPATFKVLDFDGVTWNDVGRISGSRRDYFGIEGALALSGDGKRLAVGAPGAGELDNGYVQVYEHKEGTVWKPLGSKLIGTPDEPCFGKNISMSKDGTRMAVSSVRDVRVFELDRGLKQRIVQAIFGEADWGTLILEFLGENWNQAGRSLVRGRVGCGAISANGNVVAVGFEDDDGYCSTTVFNYSSNQGNRDWVQVGESLDMKTLENSHKRLSINAKGNLLVVHKRKEVEIFHLDDNNWKSTGKISCGRCCFGCLAPDANKIAFSGSYHENSVKVFSHNGNEWILEANVMPSSGVRGNPHFVSLSSSGDQLAVGSTIKYEGGVKGQVRNYKLG